MTISVSTVPTGTTIPFVGPRFLNTPEGQMWTADFSLTVSEVFAQTGVETVTPLNIKNGEEWNTPSNTWIKHEDDWRRIQSAHIVSEGAWKKVEVFPQTNPIGTFKKRITLRSTWHNVANPNYFLSFGYTRLPTFEGNALHVPAGWKIVKAYLSGLYDDICDGMYLRGESVNDPATVLYRRYEVPNFGGGAGFVGRASPVTCCGNYAVNGQAPHGPIPNWSYINNFSLTYEFGAGSNWTCLAVHTPDEGYAPFNCAGDAYQPWGYLGSSSNPLTPPTNPQIPLPVRTYPTLPHDFSKFVTLKAGNSCGTCNHDLNFVELVLEEP